MFISACSSPVEEKVQIRLPLNVTAKHIDSGSSFSATLTESHSEIIFGEDHSLSGTKLFLSQDGNNVSNGDFKRDIKNGIFPAYEAFCKAFRIICNEQNKPTKTENGDKYTIDEMTIMVYYDKDSKNIIAIGTEESGRSFNFDIVSLRPSDEIQSDSEGQS